MFLVATRGEEQTRGVQLVEIFRPHCSMPRNPAYWTFADFLPLPEVKATGNQMKCTITLNKTTYFCGINTVRISEDNVIKLIPKVYSLLDILMQKMLHIIPLE